MKNIGSGERIIFIKASDRVKISTGNGSHRECDDGGHLITRVAMNFALNVCSLLSYLAEHEGDDASETMQLNVLLRRRALSILMKSTSAELETAEDKVSKPSKYYVFIMINVCPALWTQS